MNTPSKSAENLFIGLGIVLLLVTAFALIDGRLPPADCPTSTAITDETCTSSSVIGWLIPGGAVVSLFLGISSRMAHDAGKRSLLDHYFTNESESDISSRVSEDYKKDQETERLTGERAVS